MATRSAPTHTLLVIKLLVRKSTLGMLYPTVRFIYHNVNLDAYEGVSMADKVRSVIKKASPTTASVKHQRFYGSLIGEKIRGCTPSVLCVLFPFGQLTKPVLTEWISLA